MCKCALISTRMTIILITYYNLIIDRQFYLSRWLKTLDVILEKEKGPVVDKLRTTQLIVADLQLLMRILVNTRNKISIEAGSRVSKCNYGSHANYSIENVILEKHLWYNNSLLRSNKIIYNMTDLKFYYNT